MEKKTAALELIMDCQYPQMKQDYHVLNEKRNCVVSSLYKGIIGYYWWTRNFWICKLDNLLFSRFPVNTEFHSIALIYRSAFLRWHNIDDIPFMIAADQLLSALGFFRPATTPRPEQRNAEGGATWMIFSIPEI